MYNLSTCLYLYADYLVKMSSGGNSDYHFKFNGRDVYINTMDKFVRCVMGREYPDRPEYYYQLDSSSVHVDTFKSVEEMPTRCIKTDLVHNKNLYYYKNLKDCWYEYETPEKLVATKVDHYFEGAVVAEYTKIKSYMTSKCDSLSLKSKLHEFLMGLYKEIEKLENNRDESKKFDRNTK